jgi:hypothetical protein
MRLVLIATTFACVLSFATPSLADCDAKDFMVQDKTSIQTSEQIQLAFVLTATREQFDKAKGSLGIFDVLSFEAAKEAASKISQTSKFDYSSSYSLSYLQQTLSGKALEAYVACLTLDKERPGITAWLSKREADYYTLRVFWVGLTPQGIGNFGAPIQVMNGQLVRSPKQWVRAVTEEVVIKKNPFADAYVSFDVAGQTGGIAIVHDPAPFLQRAISSPTVMNVDSSNISGKVCGPKSTQDCIRPTQKGAFLRLNSANLIEAKIGDPNTFSTKITQNQPEQICMTITQSTGCCECHNVSSARLTAIEQYLDPTVAAAIDEAKVVKTEPVPAAPAPMKKRRH